MSSGPFDIFLKLDGIEGESALKGHERETVVLSYEQLLDEVTVSSGSGETSVGKTVFSGVRFRKPVDKGSIPMLLASAGGTHIKTARFTFRRSGIAGAEFYKVTLEDVLVTHVAQRAGTGAQYPLSFDELTIGAGSEGFLDEVTLRFGKIHWEYQPVGPDGAPQPAVTGGWDLKANKKL